MALLDHYDQGRYIGALPELNVCNSYNINGEERYCATQMNRVDIKPGYKTFPGWMKDITGITEYAGLPQKMKNYIDYLNKFLGVPIKYI
jgi:adenylosuccinate synthase